MASKHEQEISKLKNAHERELNKLRSQLGELRSELETTQEEHSKCFTRMAKAEAELRELEVPRNVLYKIKPYEGNEVYVAASSLETAIKAFKKKHSSGILMTMWLAGRNHPTDLINED